MLSAPDKQARRYRLPPDAAAGGPLSHLAGRTPVSFAFSPAERRVMRKPVDKGPVRWVEANRTVTHGALEGAKMRMEFTPHMAGQLEAAALPFVRCVAVCAAPQTAKTTMVHSAIGYFMDVSPGPVLSIYPGQGAARENCEERAQTMINSSPRLRRMKTRNPDDFSKNLIKLQHMAWYFGWSGSAMSVSDRSIKILDLQEVDKYAERANAREGGIIEFAEIRISAFPHDHKIFITSSPTVESGPIWQALTRDCEVIFDYEVMCPHCTGRQMMVFEQIKWPHGADGHSLDPLEIKSKKLAWYECSHCHKKWDDRLRDQAIQTRTWRQRPDDDSEGEEMMRYLRQHRPARIGFHQPSWISRLVSLSTVASDFLMANDRTRSRSRRRALLHNFLNKHKAEPVFDWEKQRAESAIIRLKDDRPMGVVPGNNQVAALVAGVDTQDDSLVYVIRAVGWGLNQTSWLVRFGIVKPDKGGDSDFVKLERILFEDVYQDEAGLYYPVHLAVQDAMGHRTDEVYNFTRRYSARMRAYKGAPGRRSSPFTETTRDKFPGSKKAIPGGVQLLTCDSHYYKDMLSERLRNQPGEPGCCYMCDEITGDYARQMTAEYRDDERRLWQCPEGRANHYWDCEVMAQVAMDYLQIRFWQPPPGLEEHDGDS